MLKIEQESPMSDRSALSRSHGAQEKVGGMADMGFDSGFGALYRRPAMRVRQTLSWSVVAALLFASPTGFAQDGAATPPPAGEQTPKRQDELTTKQRRSLRLGKVDASKVPTKEKKSSTERMLVEQRSSVARGTDLLAEARGKNDIIQLNCVNEKLTQLKGLLKLSEQASLAMYEAIAAGSQDEINHQYTKIVVAHQKSGSLKAEAEQCVGELSVYSGQTEVEVEIDATITAQDPTLPILPPPGPAVSAPASDF